MREGVKMSAFWGLREDSGKKRRARARGETIEAPARLPTTTTEGGGGFHSSCPRLID